MTMRISRIGWLTISRAGWASSTTRASGISGAPPRSTACCWAACDGCCAVVSPACAPSIPVLGGLISALSLLATGWLLYGIGRNARAPLCGLAAGLFYITNPMIFVTFGGEMPFQIALITGAFFAYQQGGAADRRGAGGAGDHDAAGWRAGRGRAARL